MLLTETQWRALTRLYVAGKRGIAYRGRGYPDAGPWSDLRVLRDNDPPLMREVTRSGDVRGQHFVVITDAGKRFYEDNERMYLVFYPPA